MTTKNISLGVMLNMKQIARCQELVDLFGDQAAKRIEAAVIRPDLKNINKRLGQENDPTYLSYAVVYALQTWKERQ